MNIVLEIVKYCILFRIIWIDLNKRIIPEEGFVILLALGLISAIQNTNLEGYYLGICAYSMPMIVLYILEDYFKKSLIGFGDVKLMMGIGGLFRYSGVENIFKFYTMLYIFSGIVVLFLLFFKKLQKCEYIPFAPFIIASYIFFNHFKIFFG